MRKAKSTHYVSGQFRGYGPKWGHFDGRTMDQNPRFRGGKTARERADGTHRQRFVNRQNCPYRGKA